MEIELKLEIAGDAVETIATSGVLAGEPKITRLEATYFDTPEQDLRKSGFSLRVRKEDDRLVQTVKGTSSAAAGLFARPEWELPLQSGTPVLDDRTPLPLLLGDRLQAIAPAFRVQVERRIWTVERDGSSIEVALDKGIAEAGTRQSPIAELELEVKSGDVASAFALARQIADVIPVRLAVRTKAERGYNLLADEQAGSFKAEKLDLRPDMSAEAAFRSIIGSCLRQYRLNEQLVLSTKSVAALHQARVAIRRLRAAFTVFKSIFADARAERLQGELRDLAVLLGQGRDIDVLIERNQEPALAERLGAAREAAYSRILEALESAPVRMLMLEVVEWTELGAWTTDDDTKERRSKSAARFSAKPLEKFRKKVKKSGKNLQSLDDEQRHEVRKDAKKLRYASEFFAGLYTAKDEQRRHKKFVRALEALQEELGRLNDLAAAPHLVEQLGLQDHPAAKALLAGGKKKKILAAAGEAHGDFIDAKRFWR